MEFKKCYFEIIKIPKWRWIVAAIFIIFGLWGGYDYTLFSGCPNNVSFFELSLYQNNDQIYLCILIALPILLVLSGVKQNEISRFTYKHSVLLIAFLCFLITIVLIICNIISYLLYPGLEISFVNEYSSSVFSSSTLKPIWLLCISYLLIFLRVMFCASCVFRYNYIFKSELGIIIPILIAVIDLVFNSIFNIQNPLYILPIEHTRVLFSEAEVPNFMNIERPSIILSIIYWFVLISIVNFVGFVVQRKRKEMENKHEVYLGAD